ncbi:MAG TPA: hypothetical protein DDY49_08410 [Paenibacillaceae bacterium]|nr:hypothetical protein [Paenibacillaceae bacterium]
MPGHIEKDRSWFWKIGSLVAILIIVYLFSDPISVFVKNHKWELLLTYVGLMLFISWVFSNWFQYHIENLRRSWYFLFIIGIAMFLGEKGFEESQWAIFGMLVSMFIFVDLAIFLTPMISKIAGAEFVPKGVQHMERTNKNMKLAIEKTQSKSQVFTTFVSRVLPDQFGTTIWESSVEYRDSLELFMEPYAQECHQRIAVLSIPDLDTFIRELGSSLGIQLNEEQKTTISNGEFLEISKQMNFIPFHKPNLYPVVIVVMTDKDVIHQIDVSNILNIAMIHSWYHATEDKEATVEETR